MSRGRGAGKGGRVRTAHLRVSGVFVARRRRTVSRGGGGVLGLSGRRGVDGRSGSLIGGWLAGGVVCAAVACVGGGDCEGDEDDWEKGEEFHGFEREMGEGGCVMKGI